MSTRVAAGSRKALLVAVGAAVVFVIGLWQPVPAVACTVAASTVDDQLAMPGVVVFEGTVERREPRPEVLPQYDPQNWEYAVVTVERVAVGEPGRSVAVKDYELDLTYSASDCSRPGQLEVGSRHLFAAVPVSEAVADADLPSLTMVLGTSDSDHNEIVQRYGPPRSWRKPSEKSGVVQWSPEQGGTAWLAFGLAGAATVILAAGMVLLHRRRARGSTPSQTER